MKVKHIKSLHEKEVINEKKKKGELMRDKRIQECGRSVCARTLCNERRQPSK